MSVSLVYEDDWLVVADKPAGLLTIPAPGGSSRTLTGILNENLKAKGVSYRLHPCHRLDRETSGLIIYAKGKSVQQKMMDEFKKRTVKKTYLAFVQGRLDPPQGEINRSIEGRKALTRYRTLAREEGFTVAEVMPLTGRTNQIRIHFRHRGHPLVGETKYAFRRDFALRAKRLCLHAHALEFFHPVTGKLLRLSAPLPKDMREFLERRRGPLASPARLPSPGNDFL